MATELEGSWGANMHESKPVLLRVGGRTYPLEGVSSAFIDGQFCMVLDAGGMVRCTDGSLVHDFKGESRCPACGWEGLTVPAPERPLAGCPEPELCAASGPCPYCLALGAR